MGLSGSLRGHDVSHSRHLHHRLRKGMVVQMTAPSKLREILKISWPDFFLGFVVGEILTVAALLFSWLKLFGITPKLK
jgi:hypothetical protein